MGHTLDEAIVNAEDVLQDWMDSMEEFGQEIPEPSPLEAVEVPDDSCMSSVLLVRTPRNRSVRMNLVLDANVAKIISDEAQRRGMTRKRLRRVDGPTEQRRRAADSRTSALSPLRGSGPIYNRSNSSGDKPAWRRMLLMVPTVSSLWRGTIAVRECPLLSLILTNLTWLPRWPVSTNPAVLSLRATSRYGSGLRPANLYLDGAKPGSGGRCGRFEVESSMASRRFERASSSVFPWLATSTSRACATCHSPSCQTLAVNVRFNGHFLLLHCGEYSICAPIPSAVQKLPLATSGDVAEAAPPLSLLRKQGSSGRKRDFHPIKSTDIQGQAFVRE